jgi:hypothetical protein
VEFFVPPPETIISLKAPLRRMTKRFSASAIDREGVRQEIAACRSASLRRSREIL